MKTTNKMVIEMAGHTLEITLALFPQKFHYGKRQVFQAMKTSSFN
jgi:hypothetical protein